ncbi:hypothetical protein [Modestobacter lapidis]|nr:hypothetical protein [Modestobacter lapidis]
MSKLLYSSLGQPRFRALPPTPAEESLVVLPVLEGSPGRSYGTGADGMCIVLRWSGWFLH